MSPRIQSQPIISQRSQGPRDSVRVPRTMPRNLPESTSTAFPLRVRDMANANYALYSSSGSAYSDSASSWGSASAPYYPGSDGSSFGSLSVDPMALTNASYIEPIMTDSTAFDVRGVYGQMSPGNISPPTSQAELFGSDMMPSFDMTGMQTFPETWNHGYPTPPKGSQSPPSEDDLSPLDLQLADSSSECEFLGVSSYQPNRWDDAFNLDGRKSYEVRTGSKPSQPRPIRSASERVHVNSNTAGIRERQYSKDEHSDRVKHNPRNDPLYDAKPDKDGYFYCPYAKSAASCSHKPTKQKCIYAKNLDSHLKPYTCKYGATDENCRNLRFSSNACLFRHEREMHGMHNHGMNPYLCKYPGCERARSDNGFPRRWNQRDHMKRVHGWEEPENVEDGNDRMYMEQTRRRKGPGASNAVPMRRNGSSHARTQASHYRTGSRQSVSANRYIAATDVMFSQLPMDDIQYSTFMNQPYNTNGLYMQSAY